MTTPTKIYYKHNGTNCAHVNNIEGVKHNSREINYL